MAKKLNFDTLKEMKTKELFISILWLICALVLIAVGAMIAGKDGASGVVIGIGFGIAAAGGGWAGYTAYKMITDTKNAKTCNTEYWVSYDCVSNPTKDADYELNVSLCDAQTKAEYAGFLSRKYAGVWLTSNSSNSANFDAFYIPGDTTKVELKSDNSATKGKVYLRKAKANGDDDKGVEATGAITGCVTKTLGTLTASSPSVSGLNVKLTGASGFQTTDNITLTITSNASPPVSSPSSPIVLSATFSTLTQASGYTISGQTMSSGSYKITASATGVSSVSQTFTV